MRCCFAVFDARFVVVRMFGSNPPSCVWYRVPMLTLNPSPADLASLLPQVEAGQKWLRYRRRWWLVRGEGAVRYLSRVHGVLPKNIVRVELQPDSLDRLLARLK